MSVGCFVQAAAAQQGAAGAGSRILASNAGTLVSTTTTPSITVNFDDVSSSNDRLLVCHLWHDHTALGLPTIATYDGVTGHRPVLPIGTDGGQAGRWGMFYWLESELPSTSGNKTLAVTLTVAMRGHHAHMVLIDNIDQNMPYVDLYSRVVATQTAPYTVISDYSPANKEGHVIIFSGGVAETTSSYTSGDITDAIGNGEEYLLESNAQNTPGGAIRTWWDEIPDSAEDYQATIDHGATTIDVSGHMGSIWLTPSSSEALSTTITRGSANVKTKEYVGDKTTTIVDMTAWGFDAGSDWNTYGPGFGSIATSTYTDGTSTSRTIDSCYWVDDEGTGSGDNMTFVLDGISIPNTDDTFHSISVNDGTTTRYWSRAEAEYSASVDGGTAWIWQFHHEYSQQNPFVTGSGNTLKVNIGRA